MVCSLFERKTIPYWPLQIIRNIHLPPHGRHTAVIHFIQPHTARSHTAVIQYPRPTAARSPYNSYPVSPVPYRAVAIQQLPSLSGPTARGRVTKWPAARCRSARVTLISDAECHTCHFRVTARRRGRGRVGRALQNRAGLDAFVSN